MVVVGSVLACSVLICILEIVLFFVLIWRKQKPDEFPLALDWSLLHVHEGWGSHGGVPEGTGFPVHNVNLGLKIPYVKIKFATHNFDRKLVMGKGAFGNVYRGTLQEQHEICGKTRRNRLRPRPSRIPNCNNCLIKNLPSPSCFLNWVL